MNTTLKSDDFYVLNDSGDRFSVAGIQFIGELLDQCIRAAGLDPTKVCFGIQTGTYTQVWVGYPSASTRIVENVHVKDGFLYYVPRLGPEGRSWRRPKQKLMLADPNLAIQFGEILKANLPKTSKFYDGAKKASAGGQPGI